MESAITKVRTNHTNVGKLRLKVCEAVSTEPKHSSRKNVLDKLDEYLLWLDKKLADYSTIVTTRAIPNHDKPHDEQRAQQPMHSGSCCIYSCNQKPSNRYLYWQGGGYLFFLMGYFSS